MNGRRTLLLVPSGLLIGVVLVLPLAMLLCSS